MYFGGRENIKSMEVTGGVFESAPSAPSDSFFHLGQKHTISNFRGGICPLCFETGGAYTHSAPRLRTPLLDMMFALPYVRLYCCYKIKHHHA